MTEIGSSAFQLQTVAEQRKDIINGTTLIRRMDDEMDDEDEAAIKEGKMPVYPRGMLKFELGVGDGTIIDAIEFKRLPGVILGETSLGAKLKLRAVRVLRGIREYLITFSTGLRRRTDDGVMLEPETVEFLGYQVDHLEAEQPARFLASLAERMNKPPPVHRPVPRARRLPTATPAPSAPRRTAPAITGPATFRPRETQTRLSFSPEKSDIELLDDDVANAGPSRNNTRRNSPPMSARRPSRAAGTAATAKLTNLYSQSAEVDRRMANSIPTKRPRNSTARDDDSIQSVDDFSVDFDDSFLRQIDAVEAKASVKDNRPGRTEEAEVELDDGDDEWDMDDDATFLRQLDEVEERATAKIGGEKKTSRFFQPEQETSKSGNGNGSGSRARNVQPVYVVDSDGDSGKENREPEIVYISD
jgi:RecQ-mediated genome instability protein 1